jgi:rhodanese-related sulfurtransferase
MKKIITLSSFMILIITLALPLSTQAATATWQTDTPAGYAPISWVKARGIASFIKVPDNGGYIDYLTVIYLPYNQIKLFSSSTPRVAWSAGQAPFDTILNVQDWAVPKFLAEHAKQDNPDLEFMWNAPFFNSAISPTDLSLALKSEDTTGTYITSGSRPTDDAIQNRKMLLINNQTSLAKITDFDPIQFAASSTGDQGVESFAASVTSKGTSSDVARLFIGVKSGGKELVVYCSRGASPQEASDALIAAGVPVENQIQMDGGTSVTCGYNLPGQYFVEPGRNLPYLMGAFPAYPQGTITLETINVRSGPGTANKIVDHLKKGDIIKIYEEKSGWYRIDKAEQKWVTGQYVKKM